MQKPEKFMKYEQGAELMLDALSGIHGKFKKIYGQAALRLSRDSYILSGGNTVLSEVTADSFVICDVKDGGLGEIFARRSDINAVIFGLTQDMFTVSEDGAGVRTTLEDLAQLTGSELKVIADADPAEILKAIEDTSVCLIRGKGALATGSNMRKAVAGIQIVEKACEAEVHGKLLGGTVPIDAELAEEYRREFTSDYVNRNEEKHIPFIGFDEEEFALRGRLIDKGRELVDKDLAYGSWGNISVRLNDSEMLITPSSMDYSDIKPEDIVRVNINTLDYGEQRVPSSEAPMHAALYRRYPDCNAVIHTHSNGISIFAACEAGFAAGHEEAKQLIGDIKVVKYAKPGSPELAAAVTETMADTHAAVIPHHGAIYTGPTLDTAFMIAEVIELRARTILGFDSKPSEEE
jgi:ribulose-5-phosphate 4-epimerase/fuculose-1-phosphate aldolase